ncbi:hypothetical protein BH09BAC1_BH09BAC1_19060 [soil metagenome]
MSIKEQILQEISHMDNQQQLNELLEYVRKLNAEAEKGNIKEVLAFAGSISDEEAKRMHESLDNEFNRIEGEW